MTYIKMQIISERFESRIRELEEIIGRMEAGKKRTRIVHLLELNFTLHRYYAAEAFRLKQLDNRRT